MFQECRNKTQGKNKGRARIFLAVALFAVLSAASSCALPAGFEVHNSEIIEKPSSLKEIRKNLSQKPPIELYEILRPTGLFAEKGDVDMVGSLAPRRVLVLEQRERWLYIATAAEPKWIYLDFTPPVAELDELLSPFGNSLSVYFENIETGFVYRYNAERSYLSASVPKAIFALYLYQKAERGETDLSQYLTYYSRDFDSWSSPIMSLRYFAGTAFPQRQLIGWNLSYSDNIATNIIARTHGLCGYRDFIAEIGGNPEYVSRWSLVRSQITADEAGLWAREIYHYMESEESNFNEEFKSFMLNNQFPFIVSDYPVASKTGWDSPQAWHDMAVVYAPSPYVLVILSSGRWGTEADHQTFQEISMAFQEFNTKWFVGE